MSRSDPATRGVVAGPWAATPLTARTTGVCLSIDGGECSGRGLDPASTDNRTAPLHPLVDAEPVGVGRLVSVGGQELPSASGVPTFRGAEGSLWEEFDPITLASPKGWDSDPELVWAWYAWRTGLVRSVEPNAGHVALARWAQRDGVEVRIATQNVDDLHERGGSEVLAHVHGSLFELRCAECDAPFEGDPGIPAEPVQRLEPPLCEECGEYASGGA